MFRVKVCDDTTGGKAGENAVAGAFGGVEVLNVVAVPVCYGGGYFGAPCFEFVEQFYLAFDFSEGAMGIAINFQDVAGLIVFQYVGVAYATQEEPAGEAGKCILFFNALPEGRCGECGVLGREGLHM